MRRGDLFNVLKFYSNWIPREHYGPKERIPVAMALLRAIDSPFQNGTCSTMKVEGAHHIITTINHQCTIKFYSAKYFDELTSELVSF